MSAVPSSPQPAPAPKKSGGMGLRIFLILVLLVMIALFALDVYSSRASNLAFERVRIWVDDNNLQLRSSDEVRKLVGREPDNGLEPVEHYFQETYSWRRGRLFDSRYVIVLYRKEGDKVVLHEVVQNVQPEGNDIPDKIPESTPTTPGTQPPATGETASGEKPAGESPQDAAP